MPAQALLDDASVEAVLHGGQVQPELDSLAGVVHMLRSAATQPVQPTVELAERMATGVFTSDRAGRHAKAAQTRAKLATMSLRTKVTAGLAATLTGLAGATAAGALPDTAAERVKSAIEFITPIDFPDNAEFGQEVTEDAEGGGNGQEISEKAQEHGQQPDDPGLQLDDPGLQLDDPGLQLDDPGQQTEVPALGDADEQEPAVTPGGTPTAPPTPDHQQGPPTDRPNPDEHPGAGHTGVPDDGVPAHSQGMPPPGKPSHPVTPT